MKTTIITLAALAFATSVSAAQLPPNQWTMPDHTARASKLIGMPIYNAQREQIGTVVDVLVPESGGEANALLSVGKYLGGGDKDKWVLVPINHLQLQGETVTMAATKSQLQTMAPYEHTPLDSGG